MASGDATKWDYILELNSVDALTRLSYLKDRDKEKAEQIKKMYGKH